MRISSDELFNGSGEITTPWQTSIAGHSHLLSLPGGITFRQIFLRLLDGVDLECRVTAGLYATIYRDNTIELTPIYQDQQRQYHLPKDGKVIITQLFIGWQALSELCQSSLDTTRNTLQNSLRRIDRVYLAEANQLVTSLIQNQNHFLKRATLYQLVCRLLNELQLTWPSHNNGGIAVPSYPTNTTLH